MVDRMDQEASDLKRQGLKMSWYMRGGLSYDDAMTLSIQDRELIKKIIDDNMETTKKTGLPFF